MAISSGRSSARAGRPLSSKASAGSIAAEPILRLLVAAAGALDRTLALPLQTLEVGQHELGLDQLDVVQRIDRAGAVRHPIVLETANQVEQGIDLAHVAQEAIAEALALAGAFDEAGDIDHLQHTGHDLA